MTVVGNIATTPKGFKLKNGDIGLHFRVASNERRRNGPGGGWGPGSSLFLRVTCWRQLAENVLASFDLGDPVIVRGRLYTDEFEWDGKRQTEIRLEAVTVGADVGRCTAQITRNRRRPVAVAEGAVGTEEPTTPAPAGAPSSLPAVESTEAAGAPSGSAAETTDGDGPSDDELQRLVAETVGGDGPSDDELHRLVARAEAAVGA